MDEKKFNQPAIDPIEGPMTIKKKTNRDDRLKEKFAPDRKQQESGNESLGLHAQASLAEGGKLNTSSSPEKERLNQEFNDLLKKADLLIDEIDALQVSEDSGVEEMIKKEVELLKLREEHSKLKGELENMDPTTAESVKKENHAIGSKLNLIQDHIAKTRYETAS